MNLRIFLRFMRIGIEKKASFKSILASHFKMNALHFEVLLVHKFVQGFQVDYWALLSIFLGNKKEV